MGTDSSEAGAVIPVRSRMRILEGIRGESGAGCLAGRNILLCTHATEATVELVRALLHLGASVFYVPIGYSADVACVEAARGLEGCEVISCGDVPGIAPKIDVIIEDGMRISALYDGKWGVKPGIFSIEQTTNGIFRLGDDRPGGVAPPWPVVSAAGSALKLGIENSMATPEAALSALVNRRSVSLARKNVLVLGYGSVGSGMSAACRSHGGAVSVADTDPTKRALASAHGFRSLDVSEMNRVLPEQDIIISCTPDDDGSCLGVEQFLIMKDGAMVLNAGSGHGEISEVMCRPASLTLNRARIDITKAGDDLVCRMAKTGARKTVTILCSAHPINLRLSNGTPADAIDLVFSLIVLTVIKTKPEELSKGINRMDADIERHVSRLSERTAAAGTAATTAPASLPRLHKSGDMTDEPRPWGGLRRFGPDYLGSFSVAKATFKPGTATDGHYHLTSDEAYVVLGGTAVIVTWDPNDPSSTSGFAVGGGDYLMIPGGTAHKVFVTSADDFVCLVVASPPFSPWDQFFPRVPDCAPRIAAGG